VRGCAADLVLSMKQCLGQTGRPASVVSTERVVAVSAYNVQAVKWEHGWELHVEDVGVTQCRTLATAVQQARDFVATMFDIDVDDAEIHLSVAIGGVEKDVERARKMTAETLSTSNSRRPPNPAASSASCATPACPSPTPPPSWTSAKGARLPTHQRLNPPRPAAHGTSRDRACASTSERSPGNGTRRP